MSRSAAAETTEILTGLDDVKAGRTTLTNGVRLQGEILARIVQLLRPSDEQSGLRRQELLAALIGSTGRRSC